MFTVALIGPDGAGKTTVGRRLEKSLPLPAKYLYMGVNHEASNCMLPTTRIVRFARRMLGIKKDQGGPYNPDAPSPPSRGPVRRLAGNVKSALSLINRISEEWYRQAVAWYYTARRHVVLFDRHYFSDYYAYEIAENGKGRSVKQRVHGFLLNHFYPRPDLMIYLDAPPEVLFQRKEEGTLQLLQQRREDYLQMRDVVKHFEIVDASQSSERVAQDVSDRICKFYERHAGKR